MPAVHKPMEVGQRDWGRLPRPGLHWVRRALRRALRRVLFRALRRALRQRSQATSH